MHENHRRKPRHHHKNEGGRHLPTLAWDRANAARRRRRQLRQLLHHGRYELIPGRYPRDLLWFLL